MKTGRFGELMVKPEDQIRIPNGILGFPEDQRYCLVDPGDDTLILWLQSLDHPEIVFPVLEPKIFRPDYRVTLSGSDQRELGLLKLDRAAVYSILTIPEDVTQMTANVKAPLVINLDLQIAKQVVLQENEYSIKHPIFRELKLHLMTIAQAARNSGAGGGISSAVTDLEGPAPLMVRDLPNSNFVRTVDSHL